jgi:hypothetical protein
VWALALIGFAALLVGLGIGQSQSSSKNSKISALESKNSKLTAQNSKLSNQLNDRAARERADEAAAQRIQAQAQQQQQQAAAAAAAQAQQQAAAAAAQAQQQAAAAAAAAAKMNTMAGDGLYAIGTDKNPGTYHTQGAVGSNCYYAVLSSPNTSDIVDNNNTTGSAIVSVSAGQYFQTTGCQTWSRQG